MCPIIPDHQKKSGMKITIGIPWNHCISKNNKVTVWGKGRPALTAQYRNAKEAIFLTAKEQFAAPIFECPVHITFNVWEPNRRRRDILNYTQVICDGIEGVVYENDAQIHYVIVRRCGIDKENPRIELEVKEYAPE
jgi:Holliday junction resolvase RusA-like endonuclease